jgi:hypothetical protein
MIYTDKYSLIYPDSYSPPFYSVFPTFAGSGRPSYRIPPLYPAHLQDRRRWDRKF